jgi:hypothetical protein
MIDDGDDNSNKYKFMSIITKANLGYYFWPTFIRVYKCTCIHVFTKCSTEWKKQWYMQIIHHLTNSEIIECDKTCDKFTVEEIMSCIDGPQTWVCIVVGIHTEAEGTL